MSLPLPLKLTHASLQGILDANETYAAAFAQADPALLKKLAAGQSPRIFWLGCSDSRVSAELCVLSPSSLRPIRARSLTLAPSSSSSIACSSP